MTSPDVPQSDAMAAVTAINERVSALWLAAHQDGVRNGLELAAQMAENFAKSIADNYELAAEIRAVAPYCLNELRDQLRLAALQLPDPEPPQAVTNG
ncbi:hypothetical protein A5784_30700 [Mycobacterium sp. 852013-50091_SCH5140682]|uniref:hypothetical protein n=1 Tax=Mycobacterium sp. 852013-50091_SCH5140682 TaxID=1834109 RepID=UPI0007EA6528|nr:hypothetical protein [Mycobacterium sp. 852013-50091_SCH5140682]OBC14074.1 hypothetical protein A5784_30700 [Mycobacterium sp. 852013-50091_SCH5140682]